MATFFPSLETISQFDPKPTDGEWTLLKFLESTLDDSFEVYFNPYLNGDRPDVLIMRHNYGVMIIEVKDWNLENFKLDDKKRWVYKENGAVVKSPLDQVKKYKENLFNLHVDQLLDQKIYDVRKFNIVCCAVYFHKATERQLMEMLVHPFTNDRKYQTWLRYNMDLLGSDSLTRDKFLRILSSRYIWVNWPSYLFTEELYKNFKRILSPAVHLRTMGQHITYSPKQRDIIYSDRLEQRVKGVFGSGKTTVLAARAVQAYKRALSWNLHPRVLILTYNITLKNFIHDKIMKVEEDFPLDAFIIINYHQFINAELNNLGIDFDIPEDITQEEISSYLAQKYYDNKSLFLSRKDDIVLYDAVLIDEIQDYKRVWMDIVKDCFRNPNGDYVLFGDVKQNIYGQPTENRDVSTNVRGVNELKYCYRSDAKVIDLAAAFQHSFFADKYDIDDFKENQSAQLALNLEFSKEGYIKYMYLSDTNSMIALYNIIRGNIENKNSEISANDITILGYSADFLRRFDCFYRYSCREKTNSMLENIETMYMSQLNYLGGDLSGQSKDKKPSPAWLINFAEHLKKTLFEHRNVLFPNDIITLRHVMAVLFTIYDLTLEYPGRFENRLAENCEKAKISIKSFLAWYEHYKDALSEFKKRVYGGDYKIIRDNKKLHFWMNSGTIKISTIHSFKGWESEVVFLIIEPSMSSESPNAHFDELIYTGLTRCCKNLVIINFGNASYESKLRPIINELNKKNHGYN